jgi:hypothetical protein
MALIWPGGTGQLVSPRRVSYRHGGEQPSGSTPGGQQGRPGALEKPGDDQEGYVRGESARG